MITSQPSVKNTTPSQAHNPVMMKIITELSVTEL